MRWISGRHGSKREGHPIRSGEPEEALDHADHGRNHQLQLVPDGHHEGVFPSDEGPVPDSSARRRSPLRRVPPHGLQRRTHMAGHGRLRPVGYGAVLLGVRHLLHAAAGSGAADPVRLEVPRRLHLGDPDGNAGELRPGGPREPLGPPDEAAQPDVRPHHRQRDLLRRHELRREVVHGAGGCHLHTPTVGRRGRSRPGGVALLAEQRSHGIRLVRGQRPERDDRCVDHDVEQLHRRRHEADVHDLGAERAGSSTRRPATSPFASSAPAGRAGRPT